MRFAEERAQGIRGSIESLLRREEFGGFHLNKYDHIERDLPPNGKRNSIPIEDSSHKGH